ncbi:MAG: system adenine-specific DNA-methyltransferase PglX, partial [Pseudomonadota bacterium]
DYLEHGFRVLSPSPSQGEGRGEGIIPEILDHAQDAAEALGLDRDFIVELKLAGNKDEELYRHLLLGQCHQLHQAMPFLFEALDDETELLLPDNLIRTDSILRGLVDGIPEEDWEQVEIIGWLYQFYISEKKDQVIGKVVKSEDIPAATQLFTPNWIVKYLVQNSVGRQWLMTYPESGLKAQMEYYITPAAQEPSVGVALAAITPTSIEPETIKVIDPACGSGHILVEAYNLLKAIYEERGYRSRDIPKLILENNLFGLDIDDRAAQLAGFALMMKAREDDRRIFTRDIKLNVLALQSTQDLNLPELWRKLDLNNVMQVGTTESIFDDAQSSLINVVDDVDYNALESVLVLFEHAKTFGSLIQVPHDKAEFLHDLKNQLLPLIEMGDNYKKMAASVLLPFVQQAGLLAQRYDAVIANPPYMGGKGMNPELKVFAQKHFPDSKSDLFAMFMERAFDLLKDNGYNAQVNMQSWMFLSSYQALREKLLDTHTFITMAHLGARAFGQISGEVVQTTAFVLAKKPISTYRPTFFRLIEGNEEQKQTALLSGQNRFDKTVQEDFKKISGSPVAYWVSDKVRNAFQSKNNFETYFNIKAGISSGKNDTFILFWHEVNFSFIKLNESSEYHYTPHNKGGEFRKWFGNFDYLLKYSANHISDMEKNEGFRHDGKEYYFLPHIGWSKITSSLSSFRKYPKGFTFDSAGLALFPKENIINYDAALGFLNSNVSTFMIMLLNPTLNVTPQIIKKIPLIVPSDKNFDYINQLCNTSRSDWNNYETSWDFTQNPLIRQKQPSLKIAFEQWQTQNRAAVIEMKRLEEENNRLFIDAYGLQDELTPDVPEAQITLVRADREKDIQRLISYAIGCMMGRYSLDEPGLIYVHAGNADFDPTRYQTFTADDDGIIPLTDQDWFKDDATNRFRDFVRTVWGEEHLQANLAFIAESLCLGKLTTKRGEQSLETIRRYLSNQFYKDHLQTYKKRPIYWLFSSG